MFTLFKDLKPNLEILYLIENLLDQGSMSVFYGPSNTGKSFIALDMALNIALTNLRTTNKWFDKTIIPGSTLYVITEGGRKFVNRVEAWSLFNKITKEEKQKLPFGLIAKNVPIIGEKETQNFITNCQKIEDDTKLPIKMIVFDTLSRIMNGRDENDPAEMTAFVHAMDAVKEKLNTHVCIVHHTGKEVERGARGHSSLRAAVDTEIEITRKGKIMTMTPKKQRDMEEGFPECFTLQKILLGKDKLGTDISSMALVGVDNDQLKETKQLLDIVQNNNYADFKTWCISNLPMSVKDVRKIAMHLLTPVTNNNTKYRIFNKCLDTLIRENFLYVENNMLKLGNSNETKTKH